MSMPKWAETDLIERGGKAIPQLSRQIRIACPYCDSEDLKNDFDYDVVDRICNKCGAKWRDKINMTYRG